jgi:hypothetical protein
MSAYTGVGSAPVQGTDPEMGDPIHYDGFINLSGIATIIAIEEITLGLRLGADHLLDKNRKQWLYQSKTWFGLSAGLNLN